MIKFNKEKTLRFLKGFICGITIAAAVVHIKASCEVKLPDYDDLTVESKAALIAAMLENNYIEDFDENDLADKMYAGMADAMGDPYTVYLSKEQMDDFMSEAGGTMTGIGIVISQDEESGNCIISDVLENSPAESAGLMAGDVIISIDGSDVEGMSVIDVSALTKGKNDTYMEIGILRNSSEEMMFNVKRSTVNLKYVDYKKNGNIGYIKITEFTKTASEQFKEALDELVAQGIQGLIIDLRDNPGGVIDSAAEIGDMMLPECTITYTVDKNGNRTDFTSEESWCDLPLALLVNGGSASASELLSGAVQDNGRGDIIGTQTYGKGIVQGLYGLSDGSGLKITIQRYYTPNGVCIQGEGITPDYEVYTDAKDTSENDKQYVTAVEVLNDKIKD